LIEALRYKLEGHEFDSRWYLFDFSLNKSFRQHCGPGVDTAYDTTWIFPAGKGDRRVGLTS
jgi:hypothetical protein